MPPRRSHTKSRYGCDQCKKRRVKCDEQGPPCSNCKSRELECIYSRTPVPRRQSSTPASPTTPGYGHVATPYVAQPYQRAPSVPSGDDLRAAELRRLELMHKFSTETYQSLCNSPSDFHVWQVIVPQKALRYDFLLKGILATASLHIASTLDPSSAFTYINTALEYHNQTLTPFRHAIDEISPESCDAVFAHSVVTTIICIALPRLTTEKDESIGAYEKIVLATELLQGVSNILKIYRGWVTLKPFTSGSGFWGLNMTLDPDTEAALNDLAALTDEVANSEQRDMFAEAVKLLRQCFARYANTRDIASILAWLAAADKGFIYALRCRHPLALLILMHWGVLIHELHGRLWWARNSGSALVLELLGELRSYEPRWKNILLWPKQKIGLEVH
ncbi:hypothetical protein BDW74DRAFT_101938 [Aspergillus multicolor]|uniref:Zn(II)2Cys6 transcription factor n=1 Tax=Aspergillus multicolor TaxID=41759 RepID=UPI003CCCB3ED